MRVGRTPRGARSASTLRVAVAQAPSVAGPPGPNMRTVEPLVAEAARRGARLLLLPECFPQGYSYDVREAWPTAELLEGGRRPDPGHAPGAASLCALAAAHNLHIGTTMLERTRGGDVLNSFVLAQPDGTLHPARPPKYSPANFEAYVFASHVRRDCGRTLWVPGLGERGVRLGVSVCYDTTHLTTARELSDAAPDVLLLPFCSPLPKVSYAMAAWEVAAYSRMLAALPGRMARTLRRPVLFTNQTGEFDTVTPAWYLRPCEAVMTRAASKPGQACIMDVDNDSGDADGGGGGQRGVMVRRVAGLGSELTGVAVADITLPATATAVSAAVGTVQQPLIPDGPAGLALMREHELGVRVTPSMRAVFPFNEAVGRRWYAANAALRASLLPRLD
jgi:predicted amidohydrolase